MELFRPNMLIFVDNNMIKKSKGVEIIKGITIFT